MAISLILFDKFCHPIYIFALSAGAYFTAFANAISAREKHLKN